jgi:NADH:quinone reductase (non-electrogenic)
MLRTRLTDLLGIEQPIVQSGLMQKGMLAAGQGIGLIRDIPTCRELLDRITTQAEEIITRRIARLFPR